MSPTAYSVYVCPQCNTNYPFGGACPLGCKPLTLAAVREEIAKAQARLDKASDLRGFRQPDARRVATYEDRAWQDCAEKNAQDCDRAEKERDRLRALLSECLPFIGWAGDYTELKSRIRAALSGESAPV